jgi:hypothetical protein
LGTEHPYQGPELFPRFGPSLCNSCCMQALLQKYAGREAELLATIREKYGLPDTGEFQSHEKKWKDEKLGGTVPEDNDEPAVATDGTQRYVGEKLPPLRYTVPVADGDKTSIAQRELRLRSRKVRKEKNGDTRRSLQFILGRDYLTLVQRAMRHAGEPSRVRARVREIWGSGGSLEPPGRLHTRPPHSIYGIF